MDDDSVSVSLLEVMFLAMVVYLMFLVIFGVLYFMISFWPKYQVWTLLQTCHLLRKGFGNWIF